LVNYYFSAASRKNPNPQNHIFRLSDAFFKYICTHPLYLEVASSICNLKARDVGVKYPRSVAKMYFPHELPSLAVTEKCE
jgi:hypothetical protein